MSLFALKTKFDTYRPPFKYFWTKSPPYYTFHLITQYCVHNSFSTATTYVFFSSSFLRYYHHSVNFNWITRKETIPKNTSSIFFSNGTNITIVNNNNTYTHFSNGKHSNILLPLLLLLLLLLQGAPNSKDLFLFFTISLSWLTHNHKYIHIHYRMRNTGKKLTT